MRKTVIAGSSSTFPRRDSCASASTWAPHLSSFHRSQDCSGLEMVDPFFNDLTRLSFSRVGDFSSLIPLGVLYLDSFRGLPSPAPTAPDGWNWAPPLPWITSKRGTLEANLEFLSSHDFIRATYKMHVSGQSGGAEKHWAMVRIYLLAEDCEWFSDREQRTEYKGRMLLENIWELVDTSSKAWHGIPTSERHRKSSYSAFTVDELATSGLSAIFNNLPSPQPDPILTSKAAPIVRILLESSLEDDGIPGFKSQLYQYQRESVWKMLQRELLPQKRPDPRLREWIGPTGKRCWINLEDMMVFRRMQVVDDVRGGILCEEMGTGKTVLLPPLLDLTHSISGLV